MASWKPTEKLPKKIRDMELETAKNKDLLYALSSSLNLCVVLGTERALAWADQLWEWSEEQGRGLHPEEKP